MPVSHGSPDVPTPPALRTRVSRRLRGRTLAALHGAKWLLKHGARLTERLARFARARTRHAQRKLARIHVIVSRRLRHLQRTVTHARALVFYHQPDELHECPACRSSKLALLAPMRLNGRPRGRRYGFVTGCRTCGILFANPMPTPASLRDFYSPNGEWAQAREPDPKKGKGAATTYLLKTFAEVSGWMDVTRPPDGASVLDVGSGGGELLDFFQAHGWRTFGLDPADKRAFPRHRELTAIPDSASFDVAVLHHVLEHVASPLDLLRQIHATLKSGGVLFISVPRLDTLPRHRDLHYCINPRTHIVAFSYDGLRTLLALAGFESVGVNPPIDADTKDWYALRRLRVMARKVDVVVRPAPRPLAAGRTALSRYYAGEAQAAWTRRLPPRARAAIAERRRNRLVNES